MEYLNIVGQIILISGAIWAVLSYVIVQPLTKSINKLENSINILNVKLETTNEHSHILELKIADADQRARSAHHRLDTLEDKVEKLNKKE